MSGDRSRRSEPELLCFTCVLWNDLGSSAQQVLESMEVTVLAPTKLRGFSSLAWDCEAKRPFSQKEAAAFVEKLERGYAVVSCEPVDRHTQRATWKKPVTYQSATNWFAGALPTRAKDTWCLKPVLAPGPGGSQLRVGPELTGCGLSCLLLITKCGFTTTRLNPSLIPINLSAACPCGGRIKTSIDEKCVSVPGPCL